MNRTHYLKGKRAFTLSEISLALGIAGFCLVSIMGLLTVGLKGNHDASQRTLAGEVISSIVADLRSANSGTTALYGISLTGTTQFYLAEAASAGTIGFSKVTGAQKKIARYDAEVILKQLGDTNTVVGHIALRWPVYTGSSETPPPRSSVVVPVAVQLP